MKTKKAKIITCAVIIALIGSGFAYKSFKSRVKYHTRPLERCTITQVVEASGTINPVNTVSVGSTVSGLIQDIYVDFNSQVKKGKFLPELTRETLKQQSSKIRHKLQMLRQMLQNYRQ